MYVSYACIYGWINFDTIFRMYLSDLHSQLDSVGPTRRRFTQTERFTKDIFIYKRLLLITGELISRN